MKFKTWVSPSGRTFYVGRVSNHSEVYDIEEWCKETFNNQSPAVTGQPMLWQKIGFETFMFREEQDYVLFLLRWA